LFCSPGFMIDITETDKTAIRETTTNNSTKVKA